MIKNQLKQTQNELKSDHAGFAMTIEVLCTLVIMWTFLTLSLYTLRVMNTQRYMNTVLTSTAIEASRFGGGDTQAFRQTVSNQSLSSYFNNMIKNVAPDFNTSISVTPDRITSDNEMITVTLSYQLPSVFSTMGVVNSKDGSSYNIYNDTKTQQISVTIISSMKVGDLLGD